MKRKIQNLLTGFSFLTVNSRLLLDPHKLSIPDMISKYYRLKIEAEKISKFDENLMLGMFHMLMMYLGIIGKRFKDAGLRDVLIQSQTLAEGSVDKALAGKMYNRSA